MDITTGHMMDDATVRQIAENLIGINQQKIEDDVVHMVEKANTLYAHHAAKAVVNMNTEQFFYHYNISNVWLTVVDVLTERYLKNISTLPQ